MANAIERAAQGAIHAATSLVHATPGGAIDLTRLRKVLVVRVDDRVGNVLLTTPLVRALRAGLPGAEIHWLLAGRRRLLVEGLPHVDKLISYDKTSAGRRPLAFAAMLWRLRREGYDAVIEAAHFDVLSTTQALLARWTGAPVRIGSLRGEPPPAHAHRQQSPGSRLEVHTWVDGCCRAEELDGLSTWTGGSRDRAHPLEHDPPSGGARNGCPATRRPPVGSVAANEPSLHGEVPVRKPVGVCQGVSRGANRLQPECITVDPEPHERTIDVRDVPCRPDAEEQAHVVERRVLRVVVACLPNRTCAKHRRRLAGADSGTQALEDELLSCLERLHVSARHAGVLLPRDAVVVDDVVRRVDHPDRVVANQEVHGDFQMLGIGEVVVPQNREVLGLDGAHRLDVVAQHPDVLRPLLVENSIVSECPHRGLGPVLRIVVADEHAIISIRLGQDALDRLRQPLFAVEGRNENGHASIHRSHPIHRRRGSGRDGDPIVMSHGTRSGKERR